VGLGRAGHHGPGRPRQVRRQIRALDLHRAAVDEVARGAVLPEDAALVVRGTGLAERGGADCGAPVGDVDVRIIDDDFPHIKEVDAKIVVLAKKIGAKVITNDLNLNKVAELQGVRVLNINELCNALRPVVLPGETIRVFVLKEGKEAGQGVAYLDDGTMIVVDNAKRCIGRNVDVVVTSVLQTTAGRMIFTRLKEETEKEEFQVARG